MTGRLQQDMRKSIVATVLLALVKKRCFQVRASQCAHSCRDHWFQCELCFGPLLHCKVDTRTADHVMYDTVTFLMILARLWKCLFRNCLSQGAALLRHVTSSKWWTVISFVGPLAVEYIRIGYN